MNKKHLQQYLALIKEIEDLNKKIDRCKDEIVTDSVRGSNSNFPYQEITAQIIGISENKHKRKLYKILNKRLEQSRSLKLEIEDYIASIEDSQIRYIFEKRYIDGLDWLSISQDLGSRHESYARNLHDRYLKRWAIWAFLLWYYISVEIYKKSEYL